MTPEQEKTLATIKEWLRIRIQYENAPEPTKIIWRKLLADIDHSGLLPRLFLGKKVLGQAPPRAYAYSWYALVETGKAQGGFEVEIYPEGMFHFNEPVVAIAQEIWRIVDEIEGGYIVEWPETGLRCCLRNTRAERETEYEASPADWEKIRAYPQEKQDEIKEEWWAQNTWSLEIL